jgi:hypothetical protein
MELTSRERILNLFAKKEVDRIAWSPLLDDYFISSTGYYGKPMAAVDLLRDIGADVLKRHTACCRTEYRGNVQFSQKNSDGCISSVFETPVGRIKSITRNMNCSETIIEHYIKDREDMKVLRYIEENTEFIPEYGLFLEEDEYIGADGIGTVTARPSPLAYLYENYMGLDGFVYMLEDYPEEVEALMDVVHETSSRLYKVLAKSPAPAVFMYEDTSTTTISRDYYMKYCLTQLDEYSKIVQDEGKYCFTHMCGKLKGLADLISRGRMDGIDSLCPPATGDMWVHEAMDLLAGKSIIGGIEPAMLHFGTVEEVERYTADILQKTGNFNFILCTGDATAHGTPIANLEAVTRMVKQYGCR